MSDNRAITLRGMLCATQVKCITWPNGFGDTFELPWNQLAPTVRERWRTMAKVLYAGKHGIGGDETTLMGS